MRIFSIEALRAGLVSGIATALFVGLIAGVFCSSLRISSDSGSIINIILGYACFISIVFGAGIIYGVVTGKYFIKWYPSSNSMARYIGWIAVSALSYSLALQAMARVSGEEFDLLRWMVAGIVGAGILAGGFSLLFEPLTRAHWISVLLVSTVVVLLFSLFAGTLVSNVTVSTLFSLALYIIWQTAVTSVLVPDKK